MRKRLITLFLFAIALSTYIPVTAQDAASLAGNVTDATGAVIPGTLVSLSSTLTGTSYAQKTDNAGRYRFANVPASTGYKLVFSAGGFASEAISDLTLNVGTTRTQNAMLSPSKAVQTVQVSAGSSDVTVDTSDASIGNNIGVGQLQQLPIYDRTRGIATLFEQQPGVDSYQGAVTGARVDQSEVTVDGMDADDFTNGETFYLTVPAPVDSVQQFTGTVAGMTPAVGTGSGAQFQLVTNNGTNQFHGNVNEYHRDTTTEANTWFNNLNGLKRTPLIRNQFGGNVGGPIKRDKLFFFFDLADSRIVQSQTSERIVPLDDFRAGKLDYINSSSGCGDSSRQNANANSPCITTLSSSQVAALDPNNVGFNANELAFINSRYPKANDFSQGDGVNTGGYRFTVPAPNNQLTYVGRIDYNLTPTQKVYGRFTINHLNSISSQPEFPTDPVTHPEYDRSYSYVVSHVWEIGSYKVNQFYYGDTISKLNFLDLYNPTGANQYSFTGLGGPYTNYNGQKRRIPVPEVRDDFNWVHGAHSFTLGGSFKFIKTESNLVNDFNYVQAGLTGPGLSAGLEPSVRPSDINQGPNQVGINDYDNLFATALGVVGQIYTNYSYNNKGAALPAGTGSPRGYRFFQTEAYFGDTWKATPKLTISYGLRYQLFSVPYEVHGDESVPTQISLNTYIKDRIAQQNAGNTSNTGLPFYSYVLGGKANHGPNLYDPSYKDFAPRLAFAYTPFTDGKTVINGGAGIIYDRTVINSINFLQDQISYLFYNTQYSYFGSNGGPAASLAAAPRLGSSLAYPAGDNPSAVTTTVPYTPYVDNTGTPFGLAAGQTNFVIPKDLKDPYSIALNLGIQQELPGHTVLKLSYVGRLGRRLIADADASQVIDVPDYTHKSTQSMSQAFAGLTTQVRQGASTLTAQPWFEDVLPPGLGVMYGFNNNTEMVAAYTGQMAYRGDISDALYYLAYFGLLPTNIGMPSQFGSNAYLTNMGSSNYNGMLLTVDKNMSQGLRAEFNYTWSHSIDNTSLSGANNALYNSGGMICDILHPRACRGNSDFDVRQEISSNFQYDLPFGQGKLIAPHASTPLNEAIGGWAFSGLFSYRTGLPMTALSDAYMASFDNAAPAIFTGNPADLKTKVNVDHTTNTVYQFAGGAAGAAKVLSEFRGPIGIEYGQRNLLRGPGALYFDAGLEKTFSLIERTNLIFRADAFNVFNHPNFSSVNPNNVPVSPDLNIVTNASNFGQVAATAYSPDASGVAADGARVAQFSLRLEF